MIDLQKISLQFSGDYLFRDVSLKIYAGDKISLVGANGAGKSSLMKIIMGMIEPESGTIFKQKRVSIGYLPQEQQLNEGTSLIDAVEAAVSDVYQLRLEEEDVTQALSEDIADEEYRDELIYRLGVIHTKLADLDSFTLRSRSERILVGLGFKEEDFPRSVREFSGGWQMRIALAKILVADPDIILLDEPTNHLDIDSLRWITNYLKAFKGALLLVSHDKHFVNEVTSKTVEIFLKKVTVFKGTYDAWIAYKQERDNLLEHQAAQQQKKLDETKKFIERFRYKATKAKQVQSRIKQLEKVEIIELPDSESSIHFNFFEAPSSGRVSVELKSISHAYGEKRVLNNINMIIQRGEKIAFVGPNGAGKTTLSKILAGVMPPTGGEVVLGYNTAVAYYAQEVADTLDPEDDIYETLQAMAEDRSVAQIRSLAGAFLFTGDDVFKKIKVLSGGEKSRVALLKLMLSKANLLVLDEPTNHLDIASKRILREALVNFSGSIILVSHDIDFIEPIAEKVLEFRDGKMREFPGNILYYLEKKEEELAASQSAGKPIGGTETNTDKVNRKEAKRLEAELRQLKHQATKGLKPKLAKV
ncbi:MAG: ABC-F family ATP-binding cassette domain-containing protein, partial [Ignavibacteriales bacterium]|nr:ABC-F family ATP-binding cassette domain-containing protein [Ignavibacteriales bacterium]